MMRDIDTNFDGKISEAEFLKFFYYVQDVSDLVCNILTLHNVVLPADVVSSLPRASVSACRISEFLGSIR